MYNIYAMKTKLIIFLFVLIFPILAIAGTFNGSFENDVFAPVGGRHSDDDYSNGVRFEYLFDNKLGLALGQSMYTPADLTIATNQIGERQYAGYLYLEGSYRRTDTEFGALQIGFIGENSYAEETQKLIHKWINSREPKGWANQVKGHGVEAQAYYKWMWHLIKSDYYYLCPALTLSGGSVNAMATPGLFNYICFNYVPTYMDGLPYTETRSAKDHTHSWIPSAYLFVGADCDIVGYNYFLDASESSVDKEYVVGEFSAGIGMQIKNVLLKFTYILRTRDYEQQEHHADFGCAQVGFTF